MEFCNHKDCDIDFRGYCQHEFKHMSLKKEPSYYELAVYGDRESYPCEFCLDKPYGCVSYNGHWVCEAHYARMNPEVESYKKRVVRFGAT